MPVPKVSVLERVDCILQWFMASRAKKKIYDFEKLKTFTGWVPMSFTEPEQNVTDRFP